MPKGAGMSVTEPGRTGVQAYEPVIGLEVHSELSTATKLFCGCPNEFGAEPNTHVCPVCLGLPGSLPVLNEQTVEYALRFADAVHLRVPEQSTFAAQELLLSRHAEGLPGLAVRRADHGRRLDRRRRRARRHRTRAPRGGHREDGPRRRRRSHPRGRPLARRLQPRRCAAHGDREPARHPERRARRAPT